MVALLIVCLVILEAAASTFEDFHELYQIVGKDGSARSAILNVSLTLEPERERLHKARMKKYDQLIPKSRKGQPSDDLEKEIAELNRLEKEVHDKEKKMIAEIRQKKRDFDSVFAELKEIGATEVTQNCIEFLEYIKHNAEKEWLAKVEKAKQKEEIARSKLERYHRGDTFVKEEFVLQQIKPEFETGARERHKAEQELNKLRFMNSSEFKTKRASLLKDLHALEDEHDSTMLRDRSEIEETAREINKIKRKLLTKAKEDDEKIRRRLL